MTPPAVPPVRVTTILALVAAPPVPASLTEYVAELNCTEPPETSAIVSTAVLGVPRLASPVGVPRSRLTVWGPSAVVSAKIGMLTVRLVVVGPKVSVRWEISA